jgi:hypothetical protein
MMLLNLTYVHFFSRSEASATPAWLLLLLLVVQNIEWGAILRMLLGIKLSWNSTNLIKTFKINHRVPPNPAEQWGIRSSDDRLAGLLSVSQSIPRLYLPQNRTVRDDFSAKRRAAKGATMEVWAREGMRGGEAGGMEGGRKRGRWSP